MSVAKVVTIKYLNYFEKGNTLVKAWRYPQTAILTKKYKKDTVEQDLNFFLKQTHMYCLSDYKKNNSIW